MHLFGEAVEGLKDRWDSAEALGLVGDAGLVDLAPGRMMIDRTLLAMLETRGIDVRRAAARIAMQSEGAWVDDCSGMVGVKMDHGSVIATHEGVGLPVVRTWLAIDIARYDGNNLVFGARLPDTLANASVGRLLGEIVDTGVHDLDRRIVTAVEVLGPTQQGLVSDVSARIELAPDFVRLGDAD